MTSFVSRNPGRIVGNIRGRSTTFHAHDQIKLSEPPTNVPLGIAHDDVGDVADLITPHDLWQLASIHGTTSSSKHATIHSNALGCSDHANRCGTAQS